MLRHDPTCSDTLRHAPTCPTNTTNSDKLRQTPTDADKRRQTPTNADIPTANLRQTSDTPTGTYDIHQTSATTSLTSIYSSSGIIVRVATLWRHDSVRSPAAVVGASALFAVARSPRRTIHACLGGVASLAYLEHEAYVRGGEHIDPAVRTPVRECCRTTPPTNERGQSRPSKAGQLFFLVDQLMVSGRGPGGLGRPAPEGPPSQTSFSRGCTGRLSIPASRQGMACRFPSELKDGTRLPMLICWMDPARAIL
jgi:hypothetical protein